MRIRFNISPSGEVERALIALIDSYPDGLKSELVRRLLVIGYHLHFSESDILSGININAEPNSKGTMCKLNISPLVPDCDPIMKVYNRAKQLNSLVKPLYLNKLIKSGYLFECGKTTAHVTQESSLHNNSITDERHHDSKGGLSQLTIEPTKTKLSNEEKQLHERTQPRLSLKDNLSIRNSLKNLAC